MAEADPFMTEAYDRLHDTPMQRKFRKIAPVPVGVVFIEWPGMTEDDFRRHFRLMKELGFTCLKGTMLLPGTDKRKFMHAALDEGIIPWWYDEGGWEAITDELLAKLGIPLDTPVPEVRKNERFLAHQEEVFRARIDRPLALRADQGLPADHFEQVFMHRGHVPLSAQGARDDPLRLGGLLP